MSCFTFSLLSELLASLRETMMQRALLLRIPPRYQEWVPPSPIYISEADFRELSLRDLQEPSMPLILSSLGTLMVSCVEKGKLKMPSSSAS
jgi:hypothetical protein